jgi:hypothetical protein
VIDESGAGVSGVRAREPPFGVLRPTRVQAAMIGITRATFLRRGSFRGCMGRALAVPRPGPIDDHAAGACLRMLYDLGYRLVARTKGSAMLERGPNSGA